MKSQKFTDNEGSDWTVRIGFQEIENIERDLDVKFSDMSDDNGPLMRMLNDYMFCFKCLFVVCEKQCTERGIDSVEFSQRLVGDTLTLAQDALISALIAFFPNPARREAATELVKRMRSAEVMLTRKARNELDSLDIDKLTDQILGVQPE